MASSPRSQGPSSDRVRSGAGTSTATSAPRKKAAIPAKEIEPRELARRMGAFEGARVLVVGDVMIDAYLMGDAERISPEAPVPVVLVSEETRLVGGAGNVARNITALGGKAVLVGVRGNDAAGRDLASCLDADGIEAALISLKGRPTTLKTRILARQQQVLRFDREDASELAPRQITALLEVIGGHLAGCSAVVVSDYGKGIVSEALMRGVAQRIAATGRDIPVLVDPKPQNVSLYKGVTLLTPNAKETSRSVNLPVKTPEEILRAGKTLMHMLGCKHLMTTLGAQGIAVFASADEVWHIPTVARQVFDVTGAGDTVIATTALGLAAGLPLVHSCILANYAAGLVVGKVGAATVTPAEVREAIASLPPPRIVRWL